MKSTKTTFFTVPFLIIACLSIFLFLFSRLYHLTAVPIFTDEAIYIRWAQIAKQDSTQRFISLTDGKQPLFIWAMFPMLALFPDPLVAGRMVSVCAGFGSVIGLFFLGYELFKNKWIGLTATFLYVFYPMVLVHDKMAIYDSMVGMFYVWGLYLTILLVRRVRLDIAFIASMVIGGGLLTKSSNEMNLAMIPLSAILLDWSKKERTVRFGKWAALALLTALVAYGYYSILRLSPFFYIIAQKNTTFLYPVHEWIKSPFAFFAGNFHGLLGWLITYLTIPIALLIIASFFIKRKYFFEKVFLFVAFFTPFMYAAFFGKVLYPRYMLFMSLPLLILAGVTLVYLYERIKNKAIGSFIMASFLSAAIVIDVLFLHNPLSAPIPASDKNQYINGWSAGGGVKEAVNYFNTQAKDKKIYIATEGTFGLMPYALEIYLANNQNIKIEGYWPINDILPQTVVRTSKVTPTYFLFYQPCPSCVGDGAPKSWAVTPVLSIKKGSGKDTLTVYKL